MHPTDLDRLTQRVMERAGALALYARQWIDADSAQDVVQEALTALLSQRQAPEDPVAWMFRAVRNAAIDYARSSSRRRRREQRAAAERGEWFESSADSSIDAAIAERALGKLPSEYRQIIVMRIWGQLSFAQIGQVMQLAASSVYERYVWALDQMRTTLEKPCRNSAS